MPKYDFTPTTEQIRMDYSCDYGGFLGERNKFREEYASVFDRWFAATIRAAQAKAWGDGHRTGWDDRDGDVQSGWVPSGYSNDTPNPYVEAADV